MTKLMLNGLTSKPAEKLVPLAKSWSYPAELRIMGSDGFSDSGYDPSDRAYHLTCMDNGHPSELTFKLLANADSPIVNPCFIIKNWGRSEPSININENLVKQDKKLRIGYRLTQDGYDLIIWIETETTLPLVLSVTPI